jgi:hypothetical protein
VESCALARGARPKVKPIRKAAAEVLTPICAP